MSFWIIEPMFLHFWYGWACTYGRTHTIWFWSEAMKDKTPSICFSLYTCSGNPATMVWGSPRRAWRGRVLCSGQQPQLSAVRMSELSGNSIHSYQVIQSFSFIHLRSQASLSRDKPSYCAPFQIFLTHGILKHNKMAVVLYHMFGVACYAVIVTEALSCKASCPGSHSKLV